MRFDKPGSNEFQTPNDIEDGITLLNEGRQLPIANTLRKILWLCCLIILI